MTAWDFTGVALLHSSAPPVFLAPINWPAHLWACPGRAFPVPMRVWRRRLPGYRLPQGCVCCTRPLKYSNPLRVGRLKGYMAADAVRDFKRWLDRDLSVRSFENVFGEPPTVAEIQRDLRGRNLACYCKLCPKHEAGRPLGTTCEACEPCHVDVLLPIANG